MLGIVSMAGNALKAFGNTHPAVKWGVIVLAFLLAAEFVAKEGVEVFKTLATAGVEVRAQNARAVNFSNPTRADLERVDARNRRVGLAAWNSYSASDQPQIEQDCAKLNIVTNNDAGRAACGLALGTKDEHEYKALLDKTAQERAKQWSVDRAAVPKQ